MNKYAIKSDKWIEILEAYDKQIGVWVKNSRYNQIKNGTKTLQRMWKELDFFSKLFNGMLKYKKLPTYWDCVRRRDKAARKDIRFWTDNNNPTIKQIRGYWRKGRYAWKGDDKYIERQIKIAKKSDVVILYEKSNSTASEIIEWACKKNLINLGEINNEKDYSNDIDS